MSQYIRTWENKGHRPYWMHIHIQMSGPKFKELTGFEYKHPIYVTDQKAHNASYFLKSEMDDATEHFRSYWFDDDKVDEHFRIIEDFFRRADKIRKKCFSLDWNELKEKEIVNILKELEDFCCFRYIFISNPPHVKPIEEKLEKLLSDSENKEEIISAVTSEHQEKLPFDDEQEKIAKLRRNWSNMSEREKEDALDSLVDKFGWFGGVEGEEDYDREHYLKEINSVPSPTPKVKDLHVDPEVKELGNLIARLSNKRMWCRYHGMAIRYCIRLGIEELEKRWGVTDLVYATLPEIYNFHENHDKDVFSSIPERKKGYVGTLVDGKPELVIGDEKKKYIEKVREDVSNTGEVKGRCAQPGKVKGKVRIISFTGDDYHEAVSAFEKGEILVTGMTRPQIAHLCTKAGAIITDEGGITSHASIISREFNVPCIIGSQDATKIFETGDVVEVDATNGVAKKVQ